MAVVGSSVEQWSVADLAALYAEHRSSLVRQAARILRSEADAHEVVQKVDSATQSGLTVPYLIGSSGTSLNDVLK